MARTKIGGVARAHRASSLLEIAKAHWANYRRHLQVPEEYPYAEDAERALDWQGWPHLHGQALAARHASRSIDRTP